MMKVDEGKYSIAEIVNWYNSKELVVNEEYQRGGGLWPAPAKSYFIDTILRDFPFPKIYFHERIDMKTTRPRREIVDGQQRISTIAAFVQGEFALGANARDFAGRRFADLSDETKEDFWSYAVAVDVIRNADRSDILQMFRRMNAYTLPLNAAEKRHSEFFGLFKDWVNRVLDRFGSVLIDWGVLTSRQVVRMADAEMIADLALAVEEGIVNTTPSKLLSLYKKHDKVFDAPQVEERVAEALDFVLSELSVLRASYITKPHVFHSLICALIHNRHGLIGATEQTGLAPTGTYMSNAGIAVASLKRLATAHEEKDNTTYGAYVEAASQGGNRAAQRIVRVKFLSLALRGELE